MIKEFSPDIGETRGLIVFLSIDNGAGFMEASVSNFRSGRVAIVGDARELSAVLAALPTGWETAEELHQILQADPTWKRFEFEKPTSDE